MLCPLLLKFTCTIAHHIKPVPNAQHCIAGFSGTPSDLLPLDLGRCKYEKGSDGMILTVLTSEKCVSAEELESNWTAHTLLRKVATAKSACGKLPAYRALIDTGALVTGFENIEVANELLKKGMLPGMHCVD